MRGLSFILLLLISSSVHAAKVEIAKDGMLIVDGKRTFVLGLYENPKDDAVLKQVAEAGFNLVQSSADEAALDRLHAHGLYAWVNTGSRIDFSESKTEREKSLLELAEEISHHPALLVWEVPDEALWNCWYSAQMWRFNNEPRQQRELIDKLEDNEKAERLREMRRRVSAHYDLAEYAAGEALADKIWRELGKEPPHPDLNISNAADRARKMGDGMLEGYRALRKVDPHHPIWMNHAPRNSREQLAHFNRAADIVGCDIYPAPAYKNGHSDLGDRSLSAVGAYTRIMQDAAPNKPVWMVLQGFGWADLHEPADDEARRNGRRPTYDELRFMAYDAIVHGARGILFWGTHSIEKDSQLWADLMKLAREIADLEPPPSDNPADRAKWIPGAQNPVLSAPDGNPVKITLAETWGSLDRGPVVLPKRTKGGDWYIVVNEWPEPLTYSLHTRGNLLVDPTQENVRAEEVDGKFTLKIRGNGVHILKPQ